MNIIILPDEVASQIAAGEVVERPASVVKELIENSIDAGASEINISILEAGKKLIEISDNGEGIERTQLITALARHATSKLRDANDLYKISTLGFRGEALASIASVSRYSITSRTKNSLEGGRVIVEGGTGGKLEDIGTTVGTLIRVEDLFYNVPARLKFLKKDPTEKRQIDAFVTRYAMAYPEIRFRLTQDNKITFQTSGNGDKREILSSLYNPEIAKQMLVVDSGFDQISIKGFISPTNLTRSNRQAITFFVNGRWVQDTALTSALIQAYRTMLMVGRYPMAVIFLEVPPELVDVNIHPAKSEVRFMDQGAIFRGVQGAVKRALLAFTPVPELQNQLRWSSMAETINSEFDQGIKPPPIGTLDDDSAKSVDGPIDKGDQNPLPVEGVPLLRQIGQVGASFIVAEGPDGLYLVDQHAAHERILFEKFMKMQKDKIPSQALLDPITITLSAEESNLLEDNLPVMGKLGFVIESFGPKTFRILSMPSLLIGSDPERALRVVIEDFEEDEKPFHDQIEAKIIARVCKRSAVKAGKILSTDEQKALLLDLEACSSPRTCPHGRPTMIHLSINLLERQFGRKGAR